MKVLGTGLVITVVVLVIAAVVFGIWCGEAWAAGKVYNVITGDHTGVPDITFWEMFGLTAFFNLFIAPVFRHASS